MHERRNFLSRFALALVAFVGLALAVTAAPAQTTAGAAAKPAAKAAAKAARQPLTGTPTLVRIERSGVLRVGIAINAPFVMHDRQGQAIGYSVDLARQFAAAMGWKLELVETSLPNLFSGLRSNQYDMIVSGLSITPQRALGVLFSDPVGEFDIRVVANRDRLPAGGLAELKQLANPKVGALEGSLTADFARRALPANAVVSVATESAALADLLAGKLDAYVAEAPLPQVMAQVHDARLRLLDGAPLARTAHGIALRIDDTALLRVVDAWIVYEHASGWLAARHDYWFKGTGWAEQL